MLASRRFRRGAMRLFQVAPLVLAALLGASLASADSAPRRLDDYRYFRALSIDLAGRMPTRDEIADFERPEFDVDRWIDQHLRGDAYSERLTRIYMDVLRLEVNPAVRFAPDAITLYRAELKGPDGKPVRVFYRAKQRRSRDATDGEFCLTKDETGLEFERGLTPRGTAKPVTPEVLDANTVLVAPWWLYRDYRGSAADASVHPAQRYRAGWEPSPMYRLDDSLVTEPDGTPTLAVRVCREEAQTADMGHVRATKRKAQPKDAPLPPGRWRALPLDPAGAEARAGQLLSCRTRLTAESSVECGCGVGLEHCLPTTDAAGGGTPFLLPSHLPLGIDDPLVSNKQPAGSYYPFWWSQEARHVLDHLWQSNLDFREILTGRWTFTNGPLTQFHRSMQPGNCCGAETSFGLMEDPAALFEAKNLPALLPHDANEWRFVPERSALAAGLLTTPIYLQKYASERARAAALYSAFLCKSFVAENAELPPSSENDLTKRAGCSSCHARLEPLAAYFARIEPGNVVFLPPDKFPAENPECKKNAKGAIPGKCNAFYDPVFASTTTGYLRGAHASPANANGGPAAAAREITASPDFSSCAASRVAGSFLGRSLGSDDAALSRELVEAFTKDGHRMRSLVRAVVKSNAYRQANNLSAAEWRKERAQP